MADIFKILDRHFQSLPKTRLNDYDTWDEIPLGTKVDVIGLEPYKDAVVKTEQGFFTFSHGRKRDEYFVEARRPSSPSEIDDDWIIVQ